MQAPACSAWKPPFGAPCTEQQVITSLEAEVGARHQHPFEGVFLLRYTERHGCAVLMIV